MHYPPEATGNAPYAGSLASGLVKLGHRVTANVTHPHYPEWKLREGYGAWLAVEDIEGVQVRRRRHFVPNPPRGWRRMVSELSFGVRLLLGRWGGGEVVIALSPSLLATAIAAARVRLSPKRRCLIIWVQDIYTLGMKETGEGTAMAARLMRWVESTTLRAADRVVVVHERFAAFLHTELGVTPERVEVVRNWTHLAPTGATPKSVARARLGWDEHEGIAVHTGNIGAKQGLRNIVDAARAADAMNAHIHFYVVGDGSERQDVERYARGVTRITFVDPLDPVAFRDALAAADVLLVNEKVGVEQMAVPSKLTSYFDAGRPVAAATGLGGITASEVNAASAGLVVPAGDPGALLRAVMTLLEDPQLAERYGRNGKAYRERVLSEDTAIKLWSTIIAVLSQG